MPTEFQKKFGGEGEKSSVVGLRWWYVDKYGRLIGSNDFIWRPGINTAVCEKKTQRVVPTSRPRRRLFGYDVEDLIAYETVDEVRVGCGGVEPDCECGFYAYYSADNPNANGAWGIIRGSGKTTVGSLGFRCMKAEILALFVQKECSPPVDYVRILSNDYPVARKINHQQVQRNYPEVMFFDSMETMLAEFPTDDPPLFDPDSPGFWDKSAGW